jgi:hypothetical protein
LQQTRQKLKEAYAAEFASTIERAEKQIILARHGRRLLNLLDDTPVVPGDIRASFEHASQARQVLNDAEDDLKDWQPDLEDVSSRANLDSGLMPAQQHTEGSSVLGEESTIGEGTHLAEQSEIGHEGSVGGTSVATGPGSEAPTNASVVA